VRKRSTTTGSSESTATAMTPVLMAATAAETAITRCAGKMSVTLKAAEASAPTTKPTWTATVSRVDWPALIPQSARRAGTTADAENQHAMTKICTAAIRANWVFC